MPEACANGSFARNAMSNVPTIAESAVTIYIAPNDTPKTSCPNS